MPFFGQTWAYLAAFLEVQGDLSKLETATRTAASRLKDIDLSPQRDLLSCMRSKDSAPYAARLHSGTGYERARAAVIVSHTEDTFMRALEVLDSVRFGDNDFPWLGEMLLLAKCEAAHRCQASAETGLMESFFIRQPLLFEPDHAVNFRVLEYQESLKRIYRSRRKTLPGFQGQS
jgi:hypothetical protein